MDYETYSADARRAEARRVAQAEREKKVHLFSIFGVSMPEAVGQRLVDPQTYQLTEKGRYWVQERASGQSDVPGYTFWEQVSVNVRDKIMGPLEAGQIVGEELFDAGKTATLQGYKAGQWVIEKSMEGQAGLVQDTLWSMIKGAMKKPIGALAIGVTAWYGGKFALKGLGIYGESKLKAVGARGKPLPPKILTIKSKRPPAIVNVRGMSKGKR